MEEALTRDEHERDRLDRQHSQLVARSAAIDQSIARFDGELDLCFAAGKEELARKLVHRKLEAQRLGQHLAGRREALEQALAEHEARLDTNRGQLEGMRQKADQRLHDRKGREQRLPGTHLRHPLRGELHGPVGNGCR